MAEKIKELKSGDILREDIYTIIGEKIGSVLVRVLKGKDKKVYKEVIADNGGTGYILKGNRQEIKSEEDFKYCHLIGSNYDKKIIWQPK